MLGSCTSVSRLFLLRQGDGALLNLGEKNAGELQYVSFSSRDRGWETSLGLKEGDVGLY